MRFLLASFLLLCSFGSAYADGFIIPEPWVELSIKYHRVEVEIRNQVTTTFVDQVFLNKAEWDVEGTYLFPIPEGASVSAFSMYVDGEPLVAEVLEADEARRIYTEIVRQRIDPALLEYAGRGAYRARIFPILGKGEKRVQMTYDEILKYENGVCRYVYPLNTEKFSADPLEDVSVGVSLHSDRPIKSIYSPSHDVSVRKIDDYTAEVIYADENVTPSTDFVLYYTLSEDDVGLNLLTYREADGEDGFYLLLASPKVEIDPDQVILKRLIFALDTSGSMRGEKIEQAKDALRFVLNNLGEEDLFNIVDYNNLASTFRETPVEASAENVAAGIGYVDDLLIGGGTNINDALLTSLNFTEADDRANTILFLTDGRPTLGVKEDVEILQNAGDANPGGTRIFAFGVGEEINTHLLDRLSGGNHGTSIYVLPEEDIEVAVSSFYTKISQPVLSNLSVTFDGTRIQDVYPPDLPDLFHGSQIVQLGRLGGNGDILVTLSGESRDGRHEFVGEFPAPEVGGPNEFLPRLWATRKIGFLLDQIRLYGEEQELTDEIIALSKEYGIITPYTSFLIVEDEPPPVVFEPGFREESGMDALDAARETKSYAGAGNTTAVQGEGVKYVGNKAFFLREEFWRDSQYDEEMHTVDYRYGGDRYFDLLVSHPDLGRYLAIGTNVIVVFEGTAYRIGEAITDVKEESSAPLPEGFELEPAYPNPFNPKTAIRFTVPAAAHVELAVFTPSGQQVRTLEARDMEEGTWTAEWDGRDDAGESAASGIYLCRLRVNRGRWSATRKMALVR